MSVVSIDNARTTERLSAFLTELGASKPVENFFTKNQTVDFLFKKKKSIDGGLQISYPISTGANPNFAWASDYDKLYVAGYLLN